MKIIARFSLLAAFLFVISLPAVLSQPPEGQSEPKPTVDDIHIDATSTALDLALNTALQSLVNLSQPDTPNRLGGDKSVDPESYRHLVESNAPPRLRATRIASNLMALDAWEKQSAGKSPVELTALLFDAFYSSAKGRDLLANLLFSVLSSMDQARLRIECKDRHGLYAAYLALLDTMLMSPFAQYGADAGGEQKKRAGDILSNFHVACHYHIVRLADQKELYSAFYHSRHGHKETVLARAAAFRLYRDDGNVAGFDEFMREFGVETAEGQSALALRRKRAVADTVAAITQSKRTKDWTVSPRDESIAMWDDLIADDPGTPYFQSALQAGHFAALSCEKSLNLPDREATDRARDLRYKYNDLTNRIMKALSFDPVSKQATNASVDPRKALTREVLSLLAEREHVFYVAFERYKNTEDANQLVQLRGAGLDAYLSGLRPDIAYTLDSIDSGFKKVALSIDSLDASVKAQFQAQLVAMNNKFAEVRGDLAELSRKADVQAQRQAELGQKLDTLQGSVNTLSQEVHKIAANVEQVLRDGKATAAQVNALRQGLFPVTWPGKGKTDEYVTTWEVPGEVRGGIAGPIEENLRGSVLFNEMSADGEVSQKRWGSALGVKTVIWEARVNWQVKLQVTEVNFNLPQLLLGFDKQTKQAFAFLELHGNCHAKGWAKGNVTTFGRAPVFGSGQQNFETKCQAKAKVKVSFNTSSDLPLAVEVLELAPTIESLSFSNDALNLASGAIRDRLNEKLSEVSPEFKQKLNDGIMKPTASINEAWRKMKADVRTKLAGS